MTGSHARTRPQSLAATWRVWCTLMLAFGRQVDVLQKTRADRALAQAEILEAALYAGLIQLSSDIATHDDDALEGEDATALAFLKTVHVLFSVFTLAIHQLKIELAAEADRLRDLNIYGVLRLMPSAKKNCRAGVASFYFDSG